MGKPLTNIAGIEEAGRGPVIGPMVMAIAVTDSEQESYLREIGVKDSKQLSPKRRESIFDKLIQDLPAYQFVIIPPQEIDAALKSTSSNLNWLEAQKSIELVESIHQRMPIEELFIDCPSTNTEAYANYLKSHLDIQFSCLIVEH